MEADFEKLEQLSDQELEKLVLKGTNIHISISEASVAKRILDNRRQKKQVEAAENVATVTKQLEVSHKELLAIVDGMSEIIGILTFLKKHWFPQKPLVVKIGAFILFTVGLGIAINIAADWIAKFLLHW